MVIYNWKNPNGPATPAGDATIEVTEDDNASLDRPRGRPRGRREATNQRAAGERVAVIAYLSVPLAEQLSARCDRLGISKSSAMVEALSLWLLREGMKR